MCAEHIAHKLSGKAGRREGGGGADPRAGVGGHRPGGGLAHRRGIVRYEWRLCCVNADVAVRNVLLSAGLGMGSCVHGAERAREGSWRAARGRVGCVLWCGMALARRRAGAGLPRGGLRASCAVGLRNVWWSCFMAPGNEHQDMVCRGENMGEIHSTKYGKIIR